MRYMDTKITNYRVTVGRSNVDLGSDSLLDIVQARQLLIDDAALITLTV